LLFLLRPVTLDGYLLLPLLPLSARGGLQVLLLLCPAFSSFRLLLLLRSAALGSWRLLFLLRPAALTPLLPLIRSPVLNPWLRLLSQSLFQTLLLLLLLLLLILLMLLQLIAVRGSLTCCR
jgi:hypothetical protein